MRFLFLLFTALVVSTGCSKEQQQINLAMYMAGKNRTELQAVLDHYAANGKDDLRYKAARFLIANMPGHFSFDTVTTNKYFEHVYPIITSKIKLDDKKDQIREIAAKLFESAEIVQDVEIITAHYLIYSIENAFDVWENEKWAPHLSFDEFCEYLLPYKVIDRQPLDYWRDSLKSKWEKPGGLKAEKVGYAEYMNITKAKYLHTNMKNALKPLLTLPGDITPYNAGIMDKMTLGNCDTYAVLTTATMRSKGLPIAIDFTPQWTNRSLGHTWNVLFMNDGRQKDFAGATGVDVDKLHIHDNKWAKIYRHTYKKNEELERLIKLNPNIYPTFRNMFIKDVTSEYMNTSDLRVKVKKGLKHNSEIGYLGIFNNESWIPSAYGERKGRHITFKDVGENNVFLPIFIDSGSVQINYPVKLKFGGDVEYLVPDTTNRISYTFDRKYPMTPDPYTYIEMWIGGRIEAANEENFSDSTLIYEIIDLAQAISIDVSSLPEYRYWRYVSSKGGSVNVAEMLFIGKNSPTQKLRGKIIGSQDNPNSFANKKSRMFDGDMLSTYISDKGSGSWAGMDFEAPIQLEKIICYPKTDGNIIEFGDTYRLYYMSDEGWVCIEEKKAYDITITFDRIPSNALYLLDNISRGSEKRPFTIENGKILWW